MKITFNGYMEDLIMEKFNIGDKVHPKMWVERSPLGETMFSDENGIVIRKWQVDNGSECIVVQREDGERFVANEVYWELTT